MKAALFGGDREGHTPTTFADWYKTLLEANGFLFDVNNTMQPLEHPKDLADVSLITPIWYFARSGRREEFCNMTKRQEDGLVKLIGNGCSIARWYGQMDDAFCDRPTCHFPNGLPFVAHPPGWPDNLQTREDYIDYDLAICKPDDRIEGARHHHVFWRSPVMDRRHRDRRRLETKLGRGARALLHDWTRAGRSGGSKGYINHAPRCP